MEKSLLNLAGKYFKIDFTEEKNIDEVRKKVFGWFKGNGLCPKEEWEVIAKTKPDSVILNIDEKVEYWDFMKVATKATILVKKKGIEIRFDKLEIIFVCDEKKFNCKQIQYFLIKRGFWGKPIARLYRLINSFPFWLSKELGLYWKDKEIYDFTQLFSPLPPK
jgi:hypothetical protein